MAVFINYKLSKPQFILLCNCLILCCFGIANASAQEINASVISNGGKVVISAEVKLSYTFGEPIASVKTNSEATLIQGFEQPEFDTLSVGVNYNESIIPIKIYPNPTFGQVYISIENSKPLKWSLMVYNIDAKEILTAPISTGLNEISLYQFPAGTYALVFVSEKGERLISHLIEKIN
ncbi:MAG: T9SS type A sorting domain-containing protein [Chitinophagales bacterium]